jgi:hypothetical protein
MFRKEDIFCQECHRLKDQYHTKKSCLEVRRKDKEQNKSHTDDIVSTIKSPSKGKSGDTSRALLYILHTSGILPNVQIYRTKIINKYLTGDYTHVEAASGTNFFNGVYAPSYVSSRRVGEIVSRISNLKGVLGLSNGTLYYGITKMQTKENFDFRTKYLIYLPDRFASVRTGLELKLTRECGISSEDCKEIIDLVKNSLFTDQK